MALARQTLETGKDDADVLWMAASTLLLLAGDPDVAASAIDRALMLNPNAALAWAVRGFVLSRRGQSDAAIEACERAMRLSPLDPLRRVFTMGIGLAHQVEGRDEEALS